MTQLRNLILSAITTATLSAGATTLTGLLDFSDLYGNTNAGRYAVSVKINSEKAVVLEINQRLSDPPGSDQPGSEPEVCETEIKLVAGTYDFVMTDKKTRKSQSYSQNMNLATYYYDETEKCSAPAQIIKTQHPSFMAYFNMGSFGLDYPPPFNYHRMDVALSVFPFGYQVNLNITENSRGEFVVENLDAQLENQIRRGNKEALSYYVYATQDLTTLSLGNGFVELK